MIVHRIRYENRLCKLGPGQTVGATFRIDSWWLFGIVPLFYKTMYVKDIHR